MPEATDYGAAERSALLDVARRSIAWGLEHGSPLVVEPDRFPKALRTRRASFVTLTAEGRLRGCIGALEASRALVCDVAHNAYAAAFRDPRFAPLAAQELAAIRIKIAVLTPPQPLAVGSEAELLTALRPGRDGLVLQEGSHRATFLPAVWATLPEPREFLHQLRRKAGLDPDHWSADLRLQRYETIEMAEADSG